jgi:hypothetical protein
MNWRDDLATWSEADRIDWEERAAIIEHLGGQPRALAEKAAYEIESRARQARMRLAKTEEHNRES